MRTLLGSLALLLAIATGCSSGSGSGAPGSAASQSPAPGSSSAGGSGTPGSTSAATAVPTGYRAVTLRVTAPDGTVRESCVLLADTRAEQERGLMDVDSLGGYDGMIFRFSAPITDAFYMYRTRLPLSIAFFDGDGSLVSTADMPPCTAKKASDCPLYRADGPYVNALEVVQGGLGALGVVPGSHIQAREPCQRSPAS